eukprot:5550-Heterococcus_DN1.PRE.5
MGLSVVSQVLCSNYCTASAIDRLLALLHTGCLRSLIVCAKRLAAAVKLLLPLHTAMAQTHHGVLQR